MRTAYIISCLLWLAAGGLISLQKANAQNHDHEAVLSDPLSHNAVLPVTQSSNDLFSVLDRLLSARRAYNDGEYGKSLADYRYVLLHDPEQIEARLGYGDSAYALGRIGLARTAYNQATTSDMDVEIFRRIQNGRVLVSTYDLPPVDAILRLQNAIDRDPTDIRLWLALARQHDRSESWTESAAIYRQLIAMNPKDPSSRNNYGLSLMLQGRSRAAFEQFQVAMQLAPKRSQVTRNIKIMNELGSTSP